MNTKHVTITSLSYTGHGISDNGWYILGAYPGDVIKAQKYHFAEGINYAEIVEIITSSSVRNVTPRESPFFDANAPWLYLDNDFENKTKKEIVTKLFEDIGHPGIYSELRVIDEATVHYRNKVAYSFMENNKREICFALYTRGISGKSKVIQDENMLVHKRLISAGNQLLNFFNQRKVPLKILKYLILRYSYATDSVVAHILVTESNRKKIPWKKDDLKPLINLMTSIKGILVSYSEPDVRSSLTTKDFYQVGDITTSETLLGKSYNYHPSQFFQIYPKVFEYILDDLRQCLMDIKDVKEYELLDLFAGVGLIGMSASDIVKNVKAVEYSPLSKEYAELNAQNNNINNYYFIESSVDEAIDSITSDQILVVDPPRSGMGKKLIEKISHVLPEHIIYISCNPESQAEDFRQIQEHYKIKKSLVYNIFPKTPHIEHMIYLEKKSA